MVFSKPNDDGTDLPIESEESSGISGLLNQQEQQLASLARSFVDQNPPKSVEAFELIKRSKVFFAQNLVTLSLISTAAPELRNEVNIVFDEYITKADSFKQLMNVLLFVKNPKREFLYYAYGESIEDRMRELEPKWDGSVNTQDKDQMDEKLRLLQIPVDQINDPVVCLELAAFSKDKEKYLERFLQVGGSEEDETYLKIRINEIMYYPQKGNTLRALVGRLSRHMSPVSLRSWIRDHTKIAEDPNRRLEPKNSRVILAVYIDSQPEQMDEVDWLYLAERATQLQEIQLQRICFDYLKSIQRTPLQQRVFEPLLRKFARESSEDASASRKQDAHPIFDLGAAPVNKSAALEVGRWAQSVLTE